METNANKLKQCSASFFISPGSAESAVSSQSQHGRGTVSSSIASQRNKQDCPVISPTSETPKMRRTVNLACSRTFSLSCRYEYSRDAVLKHSMANSNRIRTRNRHQVSTDNLWFACMRTRTYFTNTEEMKKSDPYAQLGLTWGATTTEIKEAYKQKARALHPDVNREDTPQAALEKFQAVQTSYNKLMDVKNGGTHRDDLVKEWSFAVWRNGDIIAQERTDVAGKARKRPAKPAVSVNDRNWGIAALGHPDGRSGNRQLRRAEYLGDGSTTARTRTSTVGTGHSKWVTKKQFKPWNPNNLKVKKESSIKRLQPSSSLSIADNEMSKDDT